MRTGGVDAGCGDEPLPPDEPPRRDQHRGLAAAKISGRAGCPPSALLSSRHDGSRRQRAGVVPSGPKAIAFAKVTVDSLSRQWAALERQSQLLSRVSSVNLVISLGGIAFNPIL
jgi:hypothetical protein